MKKYQVRKSDEQGHDFGVITFDDEWEARDFEDWCNEKKMGWHYYTKEIEV